MGKRSSNRSTSQFVNVRMPNQIRADLFAIAEKIDVPVSQIVINAVKEKLAEIESNLIIYENYLNKK